MKGKSKMIKCVRSVILIIGCVVLVLNVCLPFARSQEITGTVLKSLWTWYIGYSGEAVAVGPDSNPVLIAYSSWPTEEYHIIKLEGIKGTMLWDVRFDIGPLRYPRRISVGPDNNPVVIVNSHEVGGGLYTIKYDGTNGSVLWVATFGGRLGGAVAVGPDGNPVVNYYGGIMKYNGSTGAMLWDVPFAETARAVAVGSDGNPVVAGSFGDGFRTIKYNGTNGSVLWDITLDMFGTWPESVAIGPDGNPVVTGGELVAVKYNGATGSVLWSQFFDMGEGNYEYPATVAIGSDNNPIVTGIKTIAFDGMTGDVLWIFPPNLDIPIPYFTKGIAFGPDGNFVVAGDYTVKYAGQMKSILWSSAVKNLAESNFSPDVTQAVAVGSDGNLFVTSYSYCYGGIPADIRSFKYDGATGAVLWDVTFDSGIDDFPSGVAVGPDGNPFVATRSWNSSSLWQSRIIKYDGMTGAVLSNFVIDGWIGRIAVGPDGNPVVTNGNHVIKYNGATGAVLWDGPPLPIDTQLAALAIGPDGNPVVTGSGEYPEIRTIKYNGATGAILWTVSFDSGGGLAVAVGPDGNPVVTGGDSHEIVFNGASIWVSFVRTIKYDGLTGGILWNVTSGSSFLENEDAGGVAIGSDGHPIVAMVQYPLVRIIRYDKATGEVRSTTAFSIAEWPENLTVAMGPDGNPVLATTAPMGEPQGPTLWILKLLTETPTATGSNVAIDLNGGIQAANGATVAYSEVTGSGITTFYTSTSGTPPPEGFGLGSPPIYYQFNTTASFLTPINVCIHYNEAWFSGDEANLRLLHMEKGSWADRTTSLDSEGNIICGQVSSFSEFLIAIKLPPPYKTVAIDIKPGSYPNSINLGSGGTVPVAIFSSATFDARTVDPTTVTLASAPVKLKGKGTPMASFEDVNQDGLYDLVVHVSTEALQLHQADTEAVLEGMTFDGIRIRGVDTVRVVP